MEWEPKSCFRLILIYQRRQPIIIPSEHMISTGHYQAEQSSKCYVATQSGDWSSQLMENNNYMWKSV